MIADIVTQADNVLPQYGLAGLAILALVIALVVYYKDGKAKDKTIEAIQQARLQDAKETRDKLTESMEQMAFLTKQIYDAVISNSKRGR